MAIGFIPHVRASIPEQSGALLFERNVNGYIVQSGRTYLCNNSQRDIAEPYSSYISLVVVNSACE